MNAAKSERLWEVLTSELSEIHDITNTKPLLVHYTNMHVVESILKNSVLWLSNPLLMNDHQEVAFGIHMALNEALASQSLRESFLSEESYRKFLNILNRLYNDYGSHEVKDLYVACFSEHESSDLPDRKLSMWRAYGDGGNGAAIAFDTSKLDAAPENTPFILAEVIYQTNAERKCAIKAKVEQLAEFVKNENISEAEVSSVAGAFFRRVNLAAIFTKHKGFEEEKEWRLVYAPDRDQDKTFLRHVDYFQGNSGLEPKMKLPLDESLEVGGQDSDFEGAIHSIVIGPRAATPLSVHAAKIMLNRIDRANLDEKLVASSIPLR